MNCVICGEEIKPNNHSLCPEEINHKIISVNGVFGDSAICTECFAKAKEKALEEWHVRKNTNE